MEGRMLWKEQTLRSWKCINYLRGWLIRSGRSSLVGKLLQKDTVEKQMVRSADSVGANIGEGTGRATSQDNQRFVRIARGSLYETKHWLRRAYQRKLLTKDQVDELRGIINELTPRLNAYLTALRRK